MPTLRTSSSFGSSDRPLRRYVALRAALDRVLSTTRRSAIDGLPLREQLVRTWAYYVCTALHLKGIVVSYRERAHAMALPEFGEPDEALWREVETISATREGPPFRDTGSRLFVDRSLHEVSARVVAGLLHSNRRWPVGEIGWVGDSVDLLQDFIIAARTRELDRIAHRVTDRQTMLKELRPNSLYYNLLHAIEHVIRHDYSSTLLSCADHHAMVVAETLHHNRPAKSTRIGTYLAVSCGLDGARVISSSSGDQTDAEILRSAFGDGWGSVVQSALVLPLYVRSGRVDLVLVLGDTRPAFFSDAEVAAVEYLASRTAPIIVNSVQFGSRLEERSRALDQLIVRSNSTEDMLDRAVVWLRETFEASAATIHIGDAVHQSGSHAPRPLADDVVERLLRSERAFFQRHAEAAGSDQGAVFAAPLRLLDEDPGVVACHYERVRQPTQFDHFLFEASVRQISSAVAVRSVGDKQLSELRHVVQLMEKVAGAENDEKLLDILTSEVKTLLGATYCFVSLPERNGSVLRLRARTWTNEFDVPPIEITGRPGDGITGHVAKDLVVYRTGDVASDLFYRPIIDGSVPVEIRSEMAGPLVLDGRLIGVIDLLSSRANAFSEQAETLLRMLLAHSSIALAQTQRGRVAREHADVVERLHAELLALDKPEEIYGVILDIARDHVRSLHPGYEVFGNLYVKRPKLRFLQVKAFRGKQSPRFSPTQYFGEGVVGQVAATRQSLIIPDTSAPPEGISYEPFIEGIVRGSEIAVPIWVGDKDDAVTDAVINLESPQPALFGSEDQSALEALAHEISLAVRFAQLHEAAQIHRKSAALSEQIQFVHEVSHQVAKSARLTSQVIPEIEPLLRDNPQASLLIKQVRDRADTALRLERRLLAWRSSTTTKDAGSTKQDVIECLREAVENVRQYPDIDVQWDVTTGSFLVAGAHDLVLEFMNLFDNAIDAMRERGTLTIREHVLSDPEMFVVDVTDTGHGIRPDLVDRIWEPFVSDNGAGKPKGQGMGMALIRDHLENLGAYIELFDTTVGKGSTFRLTFTSAARTRA